MRESNFAFPAQNRACVCISSQLYDRRALDTTSPLPLFNSLHHLTYLTSTSPRIREIMTTDGGLERLVRILHDFCMCPPPPENPALIYGLSPANSRPPKLVPTLNPQTYDKHAAYRFTLAFQCVVNIGVRGSEPIRSRVVQAGTLDVVGCILEAWLANKGFAVGPSSSATGMPRETRQQRLARRQALADQRQREEVAELTRALQRQVAADQFVRLELPTSGVETYAQDDTRILQSETSLITDATGAVAGTSFIARRPLSVDARDNDLDTSNETSTNATPDGAGTPPASVLVPSRERSGTVIAHPVWDQSTASQATVRHRSHHAREPLPRTTSPTGSTDNSRPETETEDDGDGDGDADMEQSRDEDERMISPRARRGSQFAAQHTAPRPRRTVGIVSDEPNTAPMDVSVDAHIIINGQGGVGDAGEDGIVSLEPNDDFAMGAPPGAPGALDDNGPTRNIRAVDVATDLRPRNAPDATPRAAVVNLPSIIPGTTPLTGAGNGRLAAPRNRAGELGGNPIPAPPIGRQSSHHPHHREADSGPYKDEDVLLGLQLLAYLSKYPHVRQAFYKSRTTFHPASANLQQSKGGADGHAVAGPSGLQNSNTAPLPVKEPHGFFRAFGTSAGRGKEKEKSSTVATSPAGAPSQPRMTNVFSLVERFTFRPSSSETDLPNPPPKLPPEIQYWAGVIMRNACRKDDSRGGIRQCANMLCGRWESYPREFAKCRRCRKAKYCGKECQSTAWSEGHRFWCSVKDGDDEADPAPDHATEAAETAAPATDATDVPGETATTAPGTVAGRAERRTERDRNTRERLVPNTERHSSIPTEVIDHERMEILRATHPGAANIITYLNRRPVYDPVTGMPTWPNRNLAQATGSTDRPRQVPMEATGHGDNTHPGPSRRVEPSITTRRRAETISGSTSPNGEPIHIRTALEIRRTVDSQDVMITDTAGPSRGFRGLDDSFGEIDGDDMSVD